MPPRSVSTFLPDKNTYVWRDKHTGFRGVIVTLMEPQGLAFAGTTVWLRSMKDGSKHPYSGELFLRNFEYDSIYRG